MEFQQLEMFAAVALTFENAWQFIPAARDFSTLVVQAAANIEEKPATYVVSYQTITSPKD